MTYTVGEMAKLLGLPPSTLRYYDKEGLLPFVARSSGGMRIFHDKDYAWLQTIGCLKKTGMPLKEIRTYLHLALEGDGTMDARLEMLQRQRQAVLAQVAQLQQTLATLDAKCWYYTAAKEAGTPARDLPLEAIPPQHRQAWLALFQPPEASAP